MKTTANSMESIISRCFPFGLAIAFLMCQQACFAQYNLPKPAVLVENNVSAIHVTRTPLRKETRLGRNISGKSFDKTPLLLSSYFVNHTGRIDSVYQYSSDPTIYTKHVYRYELDDRLVEVNVYDTKGELWRRRLVERTPDNEIHYRNWVEEFVSLDMKVTDDSVIYECTNYQTFSPVNFYTKTVYDLEKDLKTEVTYEGDREVMRETYQWLSENGVPSRFIYSKSSKGQGEEVPTNITKEYEVAEDGSVMSENKGLFTDPFNSYNYSERFEYFTGIENQFASRLRDHNLVTKSEHYEVVDYEGAKIIYRYSMRYE